MDHRTSEVVSAASGHPATESAAPKAKISIPTIEVDAILFRAANEFTSNEDTRYYLQGVYVQPHPKTGVLLVAADGHRLICIHDETGQCSAPAIVIVEGRAFAGVKIDKKNPTDRPRLKLDAEGHAVVATYRVMEPSVIDGTYPDYPRILVPMVKALQAAVFAPASFNHEYLVGFHRVADMIAGASKAIRLISTAESDPALVLFEGAPHAFGVLMPMRTTCQNGMPAWMRPILEPPAAKPASAVAAPRKASKPISKRKVAPLKKKRRAKTGK